MTLTTPELCRKASFGLLRRRSTKRTVALSHTISSASTQSAGTVFRRALATLEQEKPGRRLLEWRKGEVAEGAIASWREEVADELLLSQVGDSEVIEASLEDLRRLLETSEVFSSSFFLDDLTIPKTPSSPSEAAASVWEDEPGPSIPERSSSLPTDRVPLRLSQQRALPNPPTPVFPSLYYQFPADDPSGSLAFASPCSSSSVFAPPPQRHPSLSTLPPKAAALLGLLPPSSELDPGLSEHPAPNSPSVLSRLPFATPTSFEFPLPRPPFATIGHRRGSNDSSTFTVRTDGSASTSSFWSSCLPGSSMSSSVDVTHLSPADQAPLLDIKAHGRDPSREVGPTAAFGAQRRRALEEQYNLASAGMKMISYPASPRSAGGRGRSRAQTTMGASAQVRGRSEGRLRSATTVGGR